MAYSTSLSQSQSSGGQRVDPTLLQLYNDQLTRSQGQYQNVLDAFTKSGKLLSDNLGNIYSGYDSLNTDLAKVRRDAYDVGAKDIYGTFKKGVGDITQFLISSGLGSSTRLGNLVNQASQLAGREYGRLTSTLAQQEQAQRQQTGLSKLQAMFSGLQSQAGNQQNLGRTIAGFNFPQNFGAVVVPYQSSTSTSTGYSYNPESYGGGGGRGSGIGNTSTEGQTASQYFGNPLGQAQPNQYASIGGYSYGGGGYQPRVNQGQTIGGGNQPGDTYWDRQWDAANTTDFNDLWNLAETPTGQWY